MAIVATLVYADPNKLRYALEFDGQAGQALTLTTTGAASPDLLTDTLQGPLKKLAKAFTDGFAGFAAGALTQAQARALWLSDWSGANPCPGSPIGAGASTPTPLVPTAIATLTDQGVVTDDWVLDANVDGNGHPTIVVTITATLGAASARFLDIEVPEAIG